MIKNADSCQDFQKEFSFYLKQSQEKQLISLDLTTFAKTVNL